MPTETLAEIQQIERTVKPRSRNYKRLPVIAIHQGTTLNEAGEIGTIDQLIFELPRMPATLFVKVGAADFVGYLNTLYTLKEEYRDTWQWRTSTHERDHMLEGFRAATRVSTVVHYFGTRKGHYHKIVDPVTMYGHKLDKIWPGDEDWLVKLFQWGVQIRDFCDENGWEVRPTIGAISSQALTDPRFYPEARRKVPALTNRQVREHLPGNYYNLNVPTSTREFTAHYLDQRRAHHYHARTTSLPHSDQLYACGRFLDLAKPVFADTTPNFHGLYCLDLLQPSGRHPAFTWIDHTKLEAVFVYSNELPHLLDMGYKVTGVRATWGSHQLDTGLAEYARWSESQLDRYRDAAWIKPLVLAAYGTLATRPVLAEALFRLASKGEARAVCTGRRTLTGHYVKGKMRLEPRIANVLHRGMIEAATRAESIGFAQYLQWMGHRVLSIYADAVIVQHDDDNPLPSLPEPWRSKRTLNHLQFINQQAFTSGEMTKLPGVGREILKYRQRSPGTASRKVPYIDALTGNTVIKQIGESP